MPVAQAQTLHLDNRAAALIAEGAGDDDDLMTVSEIASWFQVSLISLHIWRMKGTGPPYRQIAPRLIRYKRSDVLAWLETRRRLHTSEYARRGPNRVGRKRNRRRD